ncbi:mobilization protein [Pseudomonas fluorescens]|uniref:mobilization protein n=1 Tax=Pseudomonas fluorescens TaxID=294 RepID=UPI001BEC4BBF|nr:mobilization protein [Pseudomonas fluorescens]MBT2375496.1 mobilization protein [Pseudomonas fluorescens]
MARTTTFTQAQLEAAKSALDQLPDLSRDKIGKSQFLESLRDQIVTLASTKGYNTAEIKSALESVGVDVSIKAISELLNAQPKRRTPRTRTPKTE